MKKLFLPVILVAIIVSISLSGCSSTEEDQSLQITDTGMNQVAVEDIQEKTTDNNLDSSEGVCQDITEENNEDTTQKETTDKTLEHVSYGEDSSAYYRYTYKDAPCLLYQGSTIYYYIKETNYKDMGKSIPDFLRKYDDGKEFICYQLDDPDFHTSIREKDVELLKTLVLKLTNITPIHKREQLLLRMFRFQNVTYDPIEQQIVLSDWVPDLSKLIKYYNDSTMYSLFENPISYYCVYDVATQKALFFIKFMYFGEDWIFFNKAILRVGDEKMIFDNLETKRDNHSGFVWEYAYQPITDSNIDILVQITKQSFQDKYYLRLSGNQYNKDYEESGLSRTSPIDVTILRKYLLNGFNKEDTYNFADYQVEEHKPSGNETSNAAITSPSETKAELDVYTSDKPEDKGYVSITVYGNRNLGLKRNFEKYGGETTITLGVEDLFGIYKGKWICNTVDLGNGKNIHIIIRDKNGKVVFKALVPSSYALGNPLGGQYWAKGEEAARIAWENAPKGTIEVEGKYDKGPVSLYGFKELWDWGIKNAGFPDISQ